MPRAALRQLVGLSRREFVIRTYNTIIIGGGVVGTNAAQMALGLGANVVIIDLNLDRLRYLDEVLPGRLTTLSSNPLIIAEAAKRADLLQETEQAAAVAKSKKNQTDNQPY